MKKVKICKRCSGVDPRELKEYSKKINCKLEFGCIAKCRQKHPELSGNYFGLIDGDFISCSSKEEFFEAMK
jgi:uncharacterized protein YuzB (UPF0349 family)